MRKEGNQYLRNKENSNSVEMTWTDSEKQALKKLGLSHVSKPSDFTDEYLPVLLSAYGATLNQRDVACLKILNTLERLGFVDFFKFAPFPFGPSYGRKCYENLKSFGDRLWQRPSFDDILEKNISRGLMLASSQNLPLNLTLNLDKNDLETETENNHLYDPRFFLPIFNNFFASDSTIDYKLFIESNCFYFTSACLSCHDQTLRKCAYSVLFKFRRYLSLYTTNSEEKTLILNLISTFRHSLTRSNQRLPFVMAVFLAKSANILLNPLDEMYTSINSFTLLKPTIDLENIPEFYTFFNSYNVDYARERRWILLLMCEGLREAKDFRVFERRFAFKLLLSFWNSNLCDEQCRQLITRLVLSTCKIQPALVELCFTHNLLAWLNTCIRCCGINESENAEQLLQLSEITLSIHSNLTSHKAWDCLKVYWASCACACIREWKINESNSCALMFSLVNALHNCMQQDSAETRDFKQIENCIKELRRTMKTRS